MPFKFFVVPTHGAGPTEQELNAFVRGHRVLTVERRLVEQGISSFWSFCVDYLDGEPGPAPPTNGRPAGARAKVDYKEVLKPEDFAVFARLRDVRREIAAAEAVPVYTIFTNEQLAQMVQSRAVSKAALEKIGGVGEARLEKYASRMLEVLAQAWKPGDETDRKSA